MTNIPFLPIVFISAGVLLSGCTDSGSPTESGSNRTTLTHAAVRIECTQVDSLNGIPGHHFGEPVSVFPGLILTKTQQLGTQTYSYPDDKPEAGWFGKHKKDVFSFYIFKDGKFQAFQAVAFGPARAALQEETIFLLGRGKQNVTNTSWVGEKARAFYTPMVLAKGPAEILEIQSLSLVQAQASEASDRLKRENAGQ